MIGPNTAYHVDAAGEQRAAQQARLIQVERALATKILEGLNALTIEDAIARAPRKEQDAANRTWRIGAHVGKMCRQLVYWEGKGEDADYRIHKTAREWYESEAGLTRARLRTATRIAVEEDLLEVETGCFRPSDRRQTTYYRLNIWEVARKIVASELENIERLIYRENRKHRRDTLIRRRRELERAQEDLDLFVRPDTGDPDPEVQGQFGQGERSRSPGYVGKVATEPGQFGTPTGEHATEPLGEHATDSPLQGGAPDASRRSAPHHPNLKDSSCANRPRRRGPDTSEASVRDGIEGDGGQTLSGGVAAGVGEEHPLDCECFDCACRAPRYARTRGVT